MSESWIAAAIFVLGVAFTTGGIVYSNRKEIVHIKLDVNRLGSKVRDEQRESEHEHFNLCLMMLAAENDRETRFKMAAQFKKG